MLNIQNHEDRVSSLVFVFFEAYSKKIYVPEFTKTKEDTAIAATNVGDFPMNPPPHMAPT